MKLTNSIELIDLAVYLPKHKTLVLADAHIGYEQHLHKAGVMIPKFQFADMIKRIEGIFKKADVETVIFNGDLKHEFGTISPQEWMDTLALWNFLEKHSKKIILIRGNHDKILGILAEKKNLEVKNYVVIDDILIAHGDKIIDLPRGIKTIIIAHEHPAIELKESERTEKYKCFLVGKYKGKTLIVQPSLLMVTEGTDVLREDLLSPYLQGRLGNFEVYIVGDKIYSFGKIKMLRN